MDAADWQRLYTDAAQFCPEVSFIALHGDEPVGFTRCLLHKAEEAGEIGQLGVAPEWGGGAGWAQPYSPPPSTASSSSVSAGLRSASTSRTSRR